jgi:hypothetical protein
MNNSLKIGAISGFIASLFTGVFLWPFVNNMIIYLEFWTPEYRWVVQNSVQVQILLSIIWGIILGIIYAKAYPVIPGKGALKGLCWGLIIYCIIGIRFTFFNLAYAQYLWALGNLITWLPLILLGLITGILYEFLCSKYCPIKELEIKKYNIMSGFHPGAIAGLCGGLAASIVAVSGPAMGLWGIAGGPVELTFDFWLGQAGAHIILNMVWGTIFGLMFTKVYDLFSGKDILRGLIYGLIIFIITTFHGYIYLIIMFAYVEAWPAIPETLGGLLTGFANAFVFGLVLGLLYRKPSK